jgi:hypothetical protein
MHLQKLMEIIVNEKKSEPFICIQDLVENGLALDRFADESLRRPSRHEITIFLASWCKMVGFDAEKYRDWLTIFCVDVLSEISSSSSSQIRHSTKSSINYIHRSDILFSCNCEDNIFKALCSSNCSIYRDMKNLYLRKIEAEQKRIEEYQRITEESEPDPASLPVTKRYQKQFEEAVALIKQYLEKGHTKKEIATFLDKKGHKTITGYSWTDRTVSRIAVEKGWAPKRKKQK